MKINVPEPNPVILFEGEVKPHHGFMIHQMCESGLRVSAIRFFMHEYEVRLVVAKHCVDWIVANTTCNNWYK